MTQLLLQLLQRTRSVPLRYLVRPLRAAHSCAITLCMSAISESFTYSLSNSFLSFVTLVFWVRFLLLILSTERPFVSVC